MRGEQVPALAASWYGPSRPQGGASRWGMDLEPAIPGSPGPPGSVHRLLRRHLGGSPRKLRTFPYTVMAAIPELVSINFS